MKVALIVGHSRSSQGASNPNGMTEFQFNEALAHSIAPALTQMGLDCELVYRKTYQQLPYDVNETDANIAISLHCNAFNKQVSGSEVLYYHTSSNGLKLAEYINEQIVFVLGLNNRGTKPIQGAHMGRAGDRGGHLLKHTYMPCVILEPFFIDNDSDLKLALDKFDELAKGIAKGIYEYAHS